VGCRDSPERYNLSGLGSDRAETGHGQAESGCQRPDTGRRAESGSPIPESGDSGPDATPDSGDSGADRHSAPETSHSGSDRGDIPETLSKKAETLARKAESFAKKSSSLAPRGAPTGVPLPPVHQGAGKSARDYRESQGTHPVVQSAVFRPRKAALRFEDLADEVDSEEDSEEEGQYEPVQGHRAQKRQRQSSTSESEHKKKKKKKKSKEKIELSEDQLAAIIQRCMEAKISTSSEEETSTPSASKLWKSFRQSIYLLHPDLPEPEGHKIPMRTKGGPTEFIAESLKLPLYPATASTLEACEEAIAAPLSKTGSVSEPLTVGNFLKPQRVFLNKLWEPAEAIGFTTPLRKNHSLPKELFNIQSLEKTTKVSDKDLAHQEQEVRETLAAWSVLRWSFSGLSQILESDMTREQAFGVLKSLVEEQESLAPVIEDRLSTLLTNTVLRRRDILLSSSSAKHLQDENLVELRASPLDGPELLSFPQELVSEERELKSSRALLAALRSKPSYRREWRPQTAAPSAAAGSAAQLAQPVASTSQAQPQQVPQQSGAQQFPVSYKNRKSWAQTSSSWGRGGRQGRSQSRGSQPFRGGRSTSSRGRFKKGKQ